MQPEQDLHIPTPFVENLFQHISNLEFPIFQYGNKNFKTIKSNPGLINLRLRNIYKSLIIKNIRTGLLRIPYKKDQFGSLIEYYTNTEASMKLTKAYEKNYTAIDRIEYETIIKMYNNLNN